MPAPKQWAYLARWMVEELESMNWSSSRCKQDKWQAWQLSANRVFKIPIAVNVPCIDLYCRNSMKFQTLGNAWEKSCWLGWLYASLLVARLCQIDHQNSHAPIRKTHVESLCSLFFQLRHSQVRPSSPSAPYPSPNCEAASFSATRILGTSPGTQHLRWYHPELL